MIDEAMIQQVMDLHAVYRMYASDGELVYVGTTSELGRRLDQHTVKRWFPRVVTITLEWFPDKASAGQAEERAIRSEQPAYNVTFRSGQKVVRPRLESVPPLRPEGLTIKQAVTEGISGPNVEAIRRALGRSSSRPRPIGRDGNADVYDRTEWCDWEEARRQPRRLTR